MEEAKKMKEKTKLNGLFFFKGCQQIIHKAENSGSTLFRDMQNIIGLSGKSDSDWGRGNRPEVN